MSETKFTKGSDEWNFFRDYFKFVQKFWGTETNESYWDELVAETGRLCEKYKDSLFVQDTVYSYAHYLQDKAVVGMDDKSEKLIKLKEIRKKYEMLMWQERNELLNWGDGN